MMSIERIETEIVFEEDKNKYIERIIKGTDTSYYIHYGDGQNYQTYGALDYGKAFIVYGMFALGRSNDYVQSALTILTK